MNKSDELNVLPHAKVEITSNAVPESNRMKVTSMPEVVTIKD